MGIGCETGTLHMPKPTNIAELKTALRICDNCRTAFLRPSLNHRRFGRLKHIVDTTHKSMPTGRTEK